MKNRTIQLTLEIDIILVLSYFFVFLYLVFLVFFLHFFYVLFLFFSFLIFLCVFVFFFFSFYISIRSHEVFSLCCSDNFNLLARKWLRPCIYFSEEITNSRRNLLTEWPKFFYQIRLFSLYYSCSLSSWRTIRIRHFEQFHLRYCDMAKANDRINKVSIVWDALLREITLVYCNQNLICRNVVLMHKWSYYPLP